MINYLLTYTALRKKLSPFNIESGELRVIYLYRYLSWFLTSLFYLMGPPDSALIFKAGVILSLFIAALSVNRLYINFNSSLITIRSLVIIETIGTTILLLPTGGLGSPFIWYALNPVLVAACFLSNTFCWLYLLFYASSATLISYKFFNEENITIFELLRNNSYLILIILLVTLMVQMLSWLTRQLSKQFLELQSQRQKLLVMNDKLQDSNTRLAESIEYIMSLYQVVESFNTCDEPDNLPQAFTLYASKLTKSPVSFFRTAPDGDSKSNITLLGFQDDENEILITYLEKLYFDKQYSNLPLNIEISGRNMMIKDVRSLSRFYGFLGIEIDRQTNEDDEKQCIRQLNFLSELCSVIYERYHLQETADHLMIIEEQNRIANEMHDSISQRMFGIVYAIHSAAARCHDISRDELQEQLCLIEDSANETMKELRSTIYKLSSRKKGQKAFYTSIKAYIDNISKLNNINSDFIFTGDEEMLSVSLKKALYRITCEAIGNSIRHGRCDNINIAINITNTYVNLKIKDNGRGFSKDDIDMKNKTGIGISNMKSLVQSFLGDFQIDSIIGKGTEINITIPTIKISDKLQGGIA